jgi:hypothetical protein
MAELLEQDINNPEAKYTNPKKPAANSKRPKLDLSLERADWVTGCSAAATRRDLRGKPPARVFSGRRGFMPSRRGIGSYRSGSLRGVPPQYSRNRRGGPYSRGGWKAGGQLLSADRPYNHPYSLGGLENRRVIVCCPRCLMLYLYSAYSKTHFNIMYVMYEKPE